MEKKCTAKTEVYARVVGFFRPVQQWNKGKQEEFKQRKMFDVAKAVTGENPATKQLSAGEIHTD